MKYEICKEIKVDGVSAWSTIAWTDVRLYAEQIMRALNAVDAGRYDIREETPAVGQPGNQGSKNNSPSL